MDAVALTLSGGDGPGARRVTGRDSCASRKGELLGRPGGWRRRAHTGLCIREFVEVPLLVPDLAKLCVVDGETAE